MRRLLWICIAVAVCAAAVGVSIGAFRVRIMGGSPTTFEGQGFAIAALLAVGGLATSRLGVRLPLLAAAAGLAVGIGAGMALRPGPGTVTTGTGTLTLDAPSSRWTMAVRCQEGGETGDHVDIVAATPVAAIEGRSVFVFGGVQVGFVTLQVVRSGVPESSPFIGADEYNWQVDHATPLDGSGDARGVVLADMPMATPVPVPNAPPMTMTASVSDQHLRSGSFRFDGLVVASADHPIPGWPLVLGGSFEWACSP
jgi:hypothetical protein